MLIFKMKKNKPTCIIRKNCKGEAPIKVAGEIANSCQKCPLYNQRKKGMR